MLRLPLLVGFVGLLVKPGATYKLIKGPMFGHPVKTFYENAHGEWQGEHHLEITKQNSSYGKVPKASNGYFRNVCTTFTLDDGSARQAPG